MGKDKDKIKQAFLEAFDREFGDEELLGHEFLVELLEGLDVDHAEAIAAWQNLRRLSLEDVQRLTEVIVVEHTCDNCGDVWHRCYPPNDDWSHFQGCQSPHDVGMLIETSKQQVFICDACLSRNPAFSLLGE